ncbi:palindromic element RPE3 domain-containing protein [Rickettsia hoogstraalii]|uniref:palindromic element RPE3 domain-containing protein n=1 Tax=Rickettsia hoogstraalii TaxID=467174 RepID=UPI00058EC212|nr:palindromic element RPE3 domain-containing protein [Rickettsia hoogstraalii]
MAYLEIFAEYIIDKLEKGTEVQIILPNNFSCLELKKILADKYKIKLPIIIPFNSLISKKTDSDYISKIEELFIISKIITEYKDLQFNKNESLKAAEILRKLFNDLIINNIDIKLIEVYNNSNYWQKIYKFLEYCFLRWQEEISFTQKQTKAAYKLKLLQEEIIRIKNRNKQIILARMFKPNVFLKRFEEELKNYIIHYNPASKQISDGISYYEPNDIYEEAKQIAYICSRNKDKRIAIITNNNKLKRVYCNFLDRYEDLLGNDLRLTNIGELLTSIIKILCNNFDLKLLFLLLKNPLINRPIEQLNSRSFRQDEFKSKPAERTIVREQRLDSKNSLVSSFVNDAVQKLELMLSNKNRFTSSPKYLLQLQFDNEDTKEYCHNLIDILFTDNPHNILDILILTKEIAEKLLPTIWEKEGGAELFEFLTNLTAYSKYINSTDKKDFPKIFSFLLSNIKYYKNTDSASIIIGRPEDLALCAFDLIILPHFNSENWTPTTKAHPWLSKKALQILNIDYEEIAPTLYSDYFNLFLQNKQVIILNAKKYDGKLSVPSNLFLKLQDVIPAPYYVIPTEAGIHLDMDSRLRGNDIRKDDIGDESTAHSHSFPSILSVTDIETLIRNPYGFYAKKILGLRKKDNIWEEPKISDFGNFIHKVLEEYSKNYDKQFINLNLLDKQNALINIGNHILYGTILPSYTKKTWQIKLTAFSKAFILFDIERRKNCKEIYFETKGELRLNIAGQDIKIIGIADRIEISKSNNITILDYKTGTIPTKKEIELGLSPQLIIESLMLLENGFLECHSQPLLCHSRESGNPITIAYVKITSTEPYVQTTEIALSIETLNKHKAGLVKLLEYYVTNKSFSYDLNLSKYNDYLHLIRQS